MATYRIKTLGVQAGSQKERVEARLMLLFRRPLEAVRPITEGNGAVLKKGVDWATAERYRDALMTCGLRCEIEAEKEALACASLAEYATQLQDHLEMLDPGRRWSFIEAEGELFGVPGPESPYPLELVVPLERLYQEWLGASLAASEDLLRHTAGMVLMGNTPGMAQDVTSYLLPIVRNCAERGQALLAAARGYSPLVFRPLCEGLEVGLAYQRGRVVHRVAQAHLQAWGLNEEAAFDAAYANLRAVSTAPLLPSPAGVLGGGWDDGYASSRMLLTELIEGAVSVGRPVVMVPTRGMLMVCSDQNEQAMDAMLKAAIAAMREEKMVMPRLLRLVDGRWQIFVPPGLERRLNSLAKYVEGNDYRLQKELLKAHELASGRNRCVVTYLVGKLGHEQVRTSACTWTRDMPSLLPKTDLLYFADPSSLDPPITVSWDAAMPVVGALMQRTDDYPPRYFVATFPNPMQLAQLAELAAAERREAKAKAAAAKAAQAAQAASSIQNVAAVLNRPVSMKEVAAVLNRPVSMQEVAAVLNRPVGDVLRSALGRKADAKPAHAR
ncbi:hypothetical protein [Pseudoduganella violaceinigra]|uniref:hypothetical protein n=1 Tax=Pseudoduganella violaceinigra TaxID=246602 RepID=UPI0012B63B99|nr:hypothetical protein [Pseudoduganella violaceinigra]